MYCLMQKYTRGYILPKNCMQNYTGGIISWAGIFLPVTLAAMKFTSMDLIGEFHPPSSKAQKGIGML